MHHVHACTTPYNPLHQETKIVFEKLYKYIGKNIKLLVDEAADEPYCFRLQRNRVYYVKESLMRKATNVCAPQAAATQVAMHYTVWCIV